MGCGRPESDVIVGVCVPDCPEVVCSTDWGAVFTSFGDDNGICGMINKEL